MVQSSIADPDRRLLPLLHGSGSNSPRYRSGSGSATGSGSFYQKAKILTILFYCFVTCCWFLPLKNYPDPSQAWICESGSNTEIKIYSCFFVLRLPRLKQQPTPQAALRLSSRRPASRLRSLLLVSTRVQRSCTTAWISSKFNYVSSSVIVFIQFWNIYHILYTRVCTKSVDLMV